jgi:serine/threonine protein kinase
MAAIQPPTEDPLEGHYRYETVKYLSSGSYGFVVLAKDRTSSNLVSLCTWLSDDALCQTLWFACYMVSKRGGVLRADWSVQVAIKFIERIKVMRLMITHSWA